MGIEFKIIKLVEEVIHIALMINQRQKNTVFFSFSGHVNWFEISVFLDGWKEYKYADFEEKISFDTDEFIYERLLNIASYLRKIGFEDEEDIENKDEDFDIFQLIDEEQKLDSYWENKKEEEKKKIC